MRFGSLEFTIQGSAHSPVLEGHENGVGFTVQGLRFRVGTTISRNVPMGVGERCP